MSKNAKPKGQRTLVTFLLDRTGSMSSCKDATIEAFNGYLDGLKEDGDALDFTFLQFDSVSLDKICVAENVSKVALLTSQTYQPRASTPLVDCAYKTIKAVEESLTKRDDKPKVVICIQTDGQENASIEHSMAELNALIKEKSALGWQFNFMGAGIDAYQQGSLMGISAQATMAYDQHSKTATRAAFTASASNTRMFARGESANTSYSMGQRAASGDAFAHRVFGPNAPATGPQPSQKPAAVKKPKIVDDFAL